MSADLVSIVIPVYNGGDYLASSIRSALAQTWPATEVVVVDDGSTDNGETRRIAEFFGDRIRYVHQENGGVGAALNRGVAEMRGRYFSWLSHDDLYDPRKIEIQMRVMQAAREPVVVFTDYDCINPDGSFLSRRRVGPLFEEGKPLLAVLEGLVNGCGLLVPKECFETCGLFEPGLFHSQDYDLWFRFAQRYPFVHVPGSLVKHRVHPGQNSHSGANRHIEEANLLWLRMLERTPPEVMRAYEGSELRFVTRSARFIRITGYEAAKVGIPRLVERRLADLTVGVALATSGAAEARAAIARLEAVGFRPRTLLMDTSSSALASLPFAAPRLVEQNRYCRVLAQDDLRSRMEAVLHHLPDDELILLATAPALLPTKWTRAALETLILEEEVDAVLPQTAPAGATFGPLEGALIRREALARAFDRSTTADGAFLRAFALTARLQAEPVPAELAA